MKVQTLLYSIFIFSTLGLSVSGQEILYNGIVLPAEWPPKGMRQHLKARSPLPVPYLENPPTVIPIDVGRQLFVDDFLIEETSLERKFHQADIYDDNPILAPDLLSLVEDEDKTVATFDDAVFYDPADQKFKMWYQVVGHTRRGEPFTSLAYSDDGFNWYRPTFDVVDCTNVVIPYNEMIGQRDNFSPWIDFEEPDLQRRFKGYMVTRLEEHPDVLEDYLLSSPDGIHWAIDRLDYEFHKGDCSSLFYNPFRSKWGFSIRSYLNGRNRHYLEVDDLNELFTDSPEAKEIEMKQKRVHWIGATSLDMPDAEWVVQDATQLYNFPVVAYESIMLATPSIHYGPHNDICSVGKYPKLTEIKLAFSRDGFHFSRGNYDTFIGASKIAGTPDRGYLRSAGGGCLISGDKLLFYYCGFSGETLGGTKYFYAGGTMHLATLRRDGFASMEAHENEGFLVTRPLSFSGGHLFVNVDAPEGSLRVEILDTNNRPIEPFTLENCIPVSTNSTIEAVSWKNGSDISSINQQPVRFRFSLKQGALYSFWVSRDETGRSDGYVGAGGPGYTSNVDTVGHRALDSVKVNANKSD
jgi:hypothetical protein